MTTSRALVGKSQSTLSLCGTYPTHDRRCEYGSPDEKASFESDRVSLKTMGTMTTVLLIGGGVLAATGATLFVVGGSSKEPQVAATASFAPGLIGLSARGSF